MAPKYATTGEAARAIGRSRLTIRHYLEVGLLRGARIGTRGQWRIDRTDLARLVREGTP